MKKKITAICFLIMGLMIPSTGIYVGSNWNNPIDKTLQSSSTTSHTSIILLIGDGMGFNHIDYGRIVEYGEEGESAILQFPYSKSIATSNIDGTITDSAASGTAIATGVKTTNGRIGTNWNAKMDLTSILEIAEDNGYATGLVAKSYINHATPAAFSAHESSRNNYEEIAEDMAGQEIEVLLGGGAAEDKFGAQISTLQSRGYNYVTTKSELAAVTETPVLGLFNDGYLPKTKDRTESTTEPELIEMSSKAIELLSSTGDPFFLMIEGSMIDTVSHSNDEESMAQEVIEFEKTVKYVKEIGEQNPSLLILVTADHETGGFSIKNTDGLTTAIPSESDDLATQISKRSARSQEIDVKWTTGGHSNREVILTGMGPNAEEILNAEHHIDTFSIMRTVVDGIETPVGPGFYDGYINMTYLYIGLGVVGLGVIVTIIVIVVKKKKLKN